MENSGQIHSSHSGGSQTVGIQHGSAADNHGQTGLPNHQAMNTADLRAHDPISVQPLFLSDSEISPITSPPGSKGYATPARQYKRQLDKTSPDARPDRRTGGDGHARSRSPKSYDPPVGPVRFNESYLIEMVESMNNMAQAIMELNKRNQTLEQECARWSKWSSDMEQECARWSKWSSENAVRVMQIEGRINEEANKSQAFISKDSRQSKSTLTERSSMSA